MVAPAGALGPACGRKAWAGGGGYISDAPLLAVLKRATTRLFVAVIQSSSLKPFVSAPRACLVRYIL